MKRTIHAAIAAFALASGALLAGTSARAAEPGFDKSAFEAMMAKFAVNDPAADASWLRHQNLVRLNYVLPDWESAHTAFDAMKTSPDKALSLAEAHLKNDPLSLDALFVAENALNRLSRPADAKVRHEQIVALLRSATHGTDGLGKDRAWDAVSVHEEYSILGILGFEPRSQALSQDGGHSYDVMEVTPPDGGKPVRVWFNIDAFFGKELGYLAK